MSQILTIFLHAVEKYGNECKNIGIEELSEINRYLYSLNKKFMVADADTFSLIFNKSSGISIDDKQFSALFESIYSGAGVCTNIQFRYQNLSDAAISNTVGLKLPTFSKLTSIDFQCCNLVDESIISISKNLPLSNLECLVLSGNRLSNNAACLLGQALATSRLKVLELADCRLDVPALIAIFASLRAKTCKIEKLDVSGALPFSTQQEITVHIEHLLKNNPKLKRLHLRKVGLRDSGVERIAAGVKHSKNLEYLDLSANKLSRDCAPILCSVIEHLKVLDLSVNRIQSEGAKHFANAIKEKNQNLNILGLTNSDIDDDGINAILNAITNKNCQIKQLYLWGNRFESESSKKLSELMTSGALSENNTDCRSNSSWHPDGVGRPAELSHHMRQFYWWTPTKGPEVDRAIPQQPGITTQ